MKIKKPEILPSPERTDDLWALLAEQQEEPYLANLHLHDVTLNGEDLTGISCNAMILENCKLIGCTLEKSSFVDVIFKNCDFSNSILIGCYLNRCELISCKWMGIDLYESSLQQLSATGCNLSYANLDHGTLTGVALEGCDLDGASLSLCKLKNFEARDCRFRGVNFFKTPLEGIDFSTDGIDGIVTSDNHFELRGMTVSPLQAVELAALLGVKVK